MRNLAMKRKLDEGWLVDVSTRLRIGPYYLIEWDEKHVHWEAGQVDFADCETEEWIWSVGRARKTFKIKGTNNVDILVQQGQVLASTDTALYQNDYFDCLWLR